MENESVKPCPNCGHCPTCGHSPYRTLPAYPTYPIYPWVAQPTTVWPTITGGTSGTSITNGDIVTFDVAAFETSSNFEVTQ